jgi:hypothetical protein
MPNETTEITFDQLRTELSHKELLDLRHEVILRQLLADMRQLTKTQELIIAKLESIYAPKAKATDPLQVGK